MRKIIFIVFLYPSFVFGQNNPGILDFQKVVKGFYHLLYSNTADNNEFKEVYDKAAYNQDDYLSDYKRFVKQCKLIVDFDDTLNL